MTLKEHEAKVASAERAHKESVEAFVSARARMDMAKDAYHDALEAYNEALRQAVAEQEKQ